MVTRKFPRLPVSPPDNIMLVIPPLPYQQHPKNLNSVCLCACMGMYLVCATSYMNKHVFLRIRTWPCACILLCFCRSSHQPQSLLMDIYSGFGVLYIFQRVTHGASDGCLYQFTATATAAALVPHPNGVCYCMCVFESMNKCPVHWLVVVVVSSFCL